MSDRRSESQIVLVLLPGNRVCLRATCAGVADAAYAPLQDSAAPAEIAKLLGELRQREAMPIDAVYGKAEGHCCEHIDVTSIADSVPRLACVAPGCTPSAQ